MSNKAAYEQKMQARFDQWSAEIDRLKARADEASADARMDYHREIEDLKQKKRNAKQKLEEFQASGDEAWEDLKGGMEAAWASLGNALRSASARFS